MPAIKITLHLCSGAFSCKTKKYTHNKKSSYVSFSAPHDMAMAFGLRHLRLFNNAGSKKSNSNCQDIVFRRKLLRY